MKITYHYMEFSGTYVLYIDDIPWAVRDTLVELVVIADAAYKFGVANCFN